MKRIAQLLTLLAVLEFCCGIFYMMIAVPTTDWFRIGIGLTHFAAAFIIYYMSTYIYILDYKCKCLRD